MTHDELSAEAVALIEELSQRGRMYEVGGVNPYPADTARGKMSVSTRDIMTRVPEEGIEAAVRECAAPSAVRRDRDFTVMVPHSSYHEAEKEAAPYVYIFSGTIDERRRLDNDGERTIFFAFPAWWCPTWWEEGERRVKALPEADKYFAWGDGTHYRVINAALESIPGTEGFW